MQPAAEGSSTKGMHCRGGCFLGDPTSESGLDITSKRTVRSCALDSRESVGHLSFLGL